MEIHPVLKQKDQITYVSEVDIVRFISENAPMDWNKCCDFIRDENISGDEGKVLWNKDVFQKKNLKYYNKNQIKWITAFFDAHPWIEKMMVVFDD
jgi:hypothetical protein